MKSVFLFLVIGLISTRGEILNDEYLLHQESLRHNYTYVQDVSESPLIEAVSHVDLDVYSWFPWKKQQIFNILEEEEYKCEEGSSKDEFPDDLFTQEQRLNGAIVLHFIGVIYFFSITGLAINYYYIPAVQCICEDLNITPDVGGAVFMATATATPELFTNIISTFIADSDMGLGAVIGSLMFNILGVASIASIATSKPVQMDWAPITRDCVVFAANIIVLIGTSWDGYIQWYEALIIMLFAIPYYIIMFQSARITRFLKRKFEVEYNCCNRNNYDVENTMKEKQVNTIYTNNGLTPIDPISIISDKPKIVEEEKVDEKTLAENERKMTEEKEAHELLKKQRLGLYPQPKDSIVRTIFWYYSWPIRLVLFCTMPNPKTYRRFYPFTFLMCIVWIGVITYLIFFMLIIISYTFSIPESVMGITVFAIGGCTPEILTGFIMARRGNSGVGVANSIGASSLAIIIALGIPWFFRAVISSYGHEKPYVNLHSNGMEYIILSMLLLILIFYLVVYFTRFTLKKITGALLILTYAVFVTFAVLMEVGVFFEIICRPY